MLDYITIGPVPNDEPCAQVGKDYYDLLQTIECRLYRQALLEHYGEPPGNACLKTKSFPHEYGTYKEVVVYYNPNNEDEVGYALEVECGLEEWPPQFKERLTQKLTERNLLQYYPK